MILHFKNVHRILLIWSVFFVLVGCQEIIDLKLDKNEPKLVVEALITDQPGPYYVKLSTTNDVYNSYPVSNVEDATVTFFDDLGNSEVLEKVVDQNGLYQTKNIVGIIGRTYYLEILFNGKVYNSECTLYPCKAIEYARVVGIFKNLVIKDGYYVTIQTKKDSIESNDFYRIKVYKNGYLYNKLNNLLILNKLSDIERIPYPFEPTDTIKVEMYSLDKQVYDYYNDLTKSINNNESLFNSPPVTSPSNISNGALGLFQASSISSKEVIIYRFE